MSTMTASVSNQGQVAALVVNFYLDPQHKEHYSALVALASSPSSESDDLIWVRFRPCLHCRTARLMLASHPGLHPRGDEARPSGACS